ncbi:MAG: 50S ribosomal protein L30e [Halobacteriota archaeon]
MTKAKRNSDELSDVNRELQKVVNSGKVVIGARETLRTLMGAGAKLVIHASNCPERLKEEFSALCKEEDVPLYVYPANSTELGLACSKPYSIASLCIINVGESEILRLLPPILHSDEES